MTGSEGGEIGRHPAYIGTMISICGLAVMLNGVVVTVVAKYHRLKSSVDIFLTNLAIGEMLHSLIVFPIQIRNSINYQHDFYGDSALCKLTMFAPLVVAMAVILSIVAMAIERYRCMLLQKTMRRQAALVSVGLIWLISIIVSGPQLYEYDTYHLSEDNTTRRSCGSEGVDEYFKIVYASLVFAIACCVPLAILMFCYSRILIFISRKANTVLRKTNGNGNDHVEHALGGAARNITARTMKVLKLLINITVSFTILWTPYFIVFALTEIGNMDDSAHQMQWPHVLGRIMAAFSTVVNPLIFILFSDKCRLWIKLALSCKSPCRAEVRSSPSTNYTDAITETQHI